jgi:hypothetical protein
MAKLGTFINEETSRETLILGKLVISGFRGDGITYPKGKYIYEFIKYDNCVVNFKGDNFINYSIMCFIPLNSKTIRIAVVNTNQPNVVVIRFTQRYETVADKNSIVKWFTDRHIPVYKVEN